MPARLPELRFDLPPQFARIGQGGQFAVYMSTDPSLSQPETPDELYTIPRVAKHPLGSVAIARFVREQIGLTDPAAIRDKTGQLMRQQHTTFWSAIDTVEHPNRRWHHLFGAPLWMSTFGPFLGGGEGGSYAATSYTQDYAQPVATLLPKLDMRREAHLALGLRIVDQYVTLECNLPRLGRFDGIMKLADNHGVTEDEELTVLDFSEHLLSIEGAARVIRNREWRQVRTRREYTQLPQPLHDHFCTQLDKRLTLDVLDNWGTDLVSTPSELSPIRGYDAAGCQTWLDYFNRQRAAMP